jgi:murein endopeptidase
MRRAWIAGIVALAGLAAGPAEALAAAPGNCRIPQSSLTAGSRALGSPSGGSLARGIPFPEETDHSFTWDFPAAVSPSPAWRRYGTEKLVLTVDCVLSAYAARHPDLARVGVADLSLPRGGPFGTELGSVGHGSHQNGLDADVLFPRRDLCECPPDAPAEVDAARAQELVSAFVAAGAQYVFVSPDLYRRGRLRGPRGVVIPLVYHDEHMHVRIRP